MFIVDSYLREWCNSIDQSDISPSHSDSAVTNSPCGNNYDSDRTATVGSKMAADTGRAPAGTSQETLYSFWKEHPVIRENCCYVNKGQNTTIEYIERLLNFSDDFYDYVSGLTDSIAIGLREELTLQCPSTTDSLNSFCSIHIVLPIIDLISQLPQDKTEWSDDTIMFTQAILVSAVVLKKEHFPNLQINENDIITQATDAAIKLVRDNNIETLERFLSYLPTTYDTTEGSCDYDHLCLLGKIVEEMNILIDETRSDGNGKRRLIVNNAVDYHEFLEKQENNMIIGLLADKHNTILNVADRLKEQLMNEFNNIQSHLKMMKTFDYKIGQANIEFVTNKLNLFEGKMESMEPKLDENINKLIESAVNTEITLDTFDVRLISTFNPLLDVLGKERSFTESLQSTADIVSMILNNAELVNVSSSLNALRSKAEEINNHFMMDSDFFKSINTIIHTNSKTEIENTIKEFTKNNYFTDFAPTVTKEELTITSGLWNNVVEASCQVILGEAGTSNDTKKLCQNLPEEIKQVFIMYEEMFDFQFELITTMASFIKTLISINSSNVLITEFATVSRLNSVDSAETDTTLSLIASLSYIVHRKHTSRVIDLYCNILEYSKGGNRPLECKGIETDVQLLLANNIPECISEIRSFYYNVPTKPAFDGDIAYVNIKQLYSSQWVPFRIPNSEWLVDKKWIQDYEKDYAIYVQQFEIYLPTDLGEKVKIFHTLADTIANNVIKPAEGTDYIVTSNNLLVSEYQMGPAKVPCQLNKRKFQNPYTYCGESDVGEICGLSLPTSQQLIHQSIYSHWNLKVVGAMNLTAPNPATDLDLVFGMKLCKVKNGIALIDFENFVKLQYVQPCCPEGQYRPNIEAACKDCPSDSYSALSGYYCEKTCDTIQ